MKGSLAVRFEAKYIPEPNSGCWLWTAANLKDRYGCDSYGVIGRPDRPKRTMLAHHAAWILYRGDLPDPTRFDIMHRCDNRLCVNPEHLLIGTRRDNMVDAARKLRTERGEDRYNALLTEADIHFIRQSREGPTALAKRLGVSPASICDVRGRRRWAWL